MARAKRRSACGKRRFRDDIEAKHALATIYKRTSGEGHVPVRWYECDGCKGVHLTSQEIG